MLLVAQVKWFKTLLLPWHQNSKYQNVTETQLVLCFRKMAPFMGEGDVSFFLVSLTILSNR